MTLTALVRTVVLVDAGGTAHLATGPAEPSLCGLPRPCLDLPGLTDGDLLACPACSGRASALTREAL